MKLLKKMWVWGAFLAMGLVVVGCEEESQFDSMVSVEETETKSFGNIHAAKDSAANAFLDILGGDDEEEADGTVEDASSFDEAVSTPIEQPAAQESSVASSSSSTNETTDSNASEDNSASPSMTAMAPETQTDTVQAVESSDVTEAEVAEAAPVEEVEPEEVDVTILIINETGVKFGMIAVIDPVTKEQVKVGSLDKDEMFILEMTWPTKEKKFRLGVYDESGNFVKDGSIDFKGITSGSVVTLSGEGTLDEIVGEVE